MRVPSAQRLRRFGAAVLRHASVKTALTSPAGIGLLRTMVRSVSSGRRYVVKTRLRRSVQVSERQHEWHLDGTHSESNFYMATHSQRLPKRATISLCINELSGALLDCGTEFLSHVPRVRVGRIRRMARELADVAGLDFLTVAEREAYVAQVCMHKRHSAPYCRSRTTT